MLGKRPSGLPPMIDRGGQEVVQVSEKSEEKKKVKRRKGQKGIPPKYPAV